MSAGDSELDLVYAEQYKATELQLYNWGTFQGIHRMAIAPEGHLIVGASGAGKSSLLDAIATILVPIKWHDLNAAARDQERKGKDRSVASYVRGAFSQGQDEDTGEITTRFLRPEATWSGLALGFDNGSGRVVTLAQLLWMRGSGTKNADVRHLYFIFERRLMLEEFASFDLDPRKIKKAFSDVFCEEDFSPYQERFMRELGIEGENALKLLHKTQSAKNLGDLNAFMRDFMLDEPSTFETVNAMVEEFGRLDEAHNALVDARHQIELLRPVRDSLATLDKERVESISIADTLDRMDEWVNARKRKLYEEQVDHLRLDEARLSSLIATLGETIDGERRSLDDLRTRYRAEGGAALEGWQRELEDKRKDLGQKERSSQKLRAAAATLGRAMPATQDAFEELRAEAKNIVESCQDPLGMHASRQAERDRLRDEKARLERDHTDDMKEYDSLRRQPSNIPAHYLDRRLELARLSGIPVNSLPYVGELLEVREEEEAWEGAIQRILRGFSLSILVSEDNWPRLARAAEERHLGFKLVYYRVRQNMELSKTIQRRKDRLPGKIEIKDCLWKAWLAKELDDRFFYACVDSIKELNDNEKAITKAGQARHGRERFEKDDRYQVYDRSNWTLGFNNDAKLAIFQQRIRESERRIVELKAGIAANDSELGRQGSLAIAAGGLAALDWQDVDQAPLVARIADLERNIAAASVKDGDLERLKTEVDGKLERVNRLEAELIELKSNLKSTSSSIAENANAARKLAASETGAFIPAATVERLELLFASNSEELNLETIAEKEKKTRRLLGERKEMLATEMKGLEDAIVEAFRRYREEWRLEAKDLEPSLAGAPEYMARLDRLELEDLPKHEARFADYLREQSYKHLTELSTRIERNRREIRKRMDIVNESLSQGRFGESTRLNIEMVDRKIPEVSEFRNALREIQDRALETGREEAESRFLRLRGIIVRLRSPEALDQRWRSLVLDVRNHVEFLAHEMNDAGDKVQSYRSGAGKSGGQRQRLATTCLAAALRYQLGGARQGKPHFAMVSMDEAFDKADNEFTARIMAIFRGFGFQMIMATPNKAVMSLEPYIGGACYVGIKDERDSRLLPIGIDRATGRLEIFTDTEKEAARAQEH